MVDGHGKEGEGNSNDGQWKCDTKVLTLAANKKHRVKMVFKPKTVSVWVNNKAACTDIPREDRKVFKNVQVYVGDPWYAAAEATVGNLYIKGDTGSSGGDGGGDGDDGESFFALVLMVHVHVCVSGKPMDVTLVFVLSFFY